ncbi:glycosyltransferase family 87 protein [Chitinophaga jiangningensis]|nr:glycosyltransferase family 87 protein [Chitinophaga jiangningensis]
MYTLGTLILFIQAVLTQRINNFHIFRSSWGHLVHGLPLYKFYPAEYGDLFLYHPSFPVLFFPFAVLPLQLSLLLWMLLNTFAVFYAVRQLPATPKQHNMILLLILLELLNAIQSSQVNPLMTALMLLTGINLQKGRVRSAALFTCILFFIKGYGAIVGIMFLFVDRKLEYLKYCIIFGITGTLLPLLFISPATLWQHYADWFALITDPFIREDCSLFGMLHAFHHDFSREPTPADTWIFAAAVGGLATAAVCTAIARTERSRFLLLAYLMIWVVIFNQAAESPTYVIAVTGAVSILTLYSHKSVKLVLLVLLIFVTSLCPTDLVPKFLNDLAVTYQLKVFPLTIVLSYIQVMLFFQSGEVKID